MEKLPIGKLQNVVFTVLLVLVALGLYLFAGRCSTDPAAAVESPAATVAVSEATAEPTQSTAIKAVPEDVFCVAMESNGLTRQKGANRNRFSTQGNIDVRYETRDGLVNAVCIIVPLVTGKPTSVSNEIEAALEKRYYENLKTQADEIREVLSIVVSAIDPDQSVDYATQNAWYENALVSRNDEKVINDRVGSVSYSSFLTTEDEQAVLLISLTVR